MPARKHFPLWVSILVLLLSVVVSRSDPDLFTGLRDSYFDAYQKIRPRPLLPSPVRIIDIDEQSLAKIGQWPWPRSRLADLVQALQDAQAAVVVLDILLAEPDRTSPARLKPLLPSEAGARLDSLPDHDVTFAKAVERGRVVTGFALVEASSTAIPALKAGFAFIGGDAPGAIPSAAGAVGTMPMIEHAAQGNGALSISLSAGGVIRQLPMLVRVGDRLLPSLAAEALRIAQGADTFVVRVTPPEGAVSSVRVGAFDIPTDSAGQVRLYASRPTSERLIPAWRVLQGEIPPDHLRGIIAIVGSTARGLQDVHQTPIGDDVPGVEFHAQVLEQAIHEIYLHRPQWAKGGELLLLLGLGSFVLVAGGRAGPTRTAVVAAIACVSAFVLSWLCFTRMGLLIDPLQPAAAVVITYFAFSLARHLRTEHEQRWIRKAFASYISPKLVNALVENPAHLRLGGERRELSFVFTDLEGFTSLVEQTPPQIVVPLLNDYLDGMIRIAFDFDGTVDKIIGDAVHIMFGAPVADPRHAERAVACALAIDRFACAFAEDKRKQGVPFGRTRIGVNSGAAIVGNFGGALRFDYTAHGDAINTAARLESANKHLGTRICVSGNTAALCPQFFGRPAGTLALKGKSEPIRVFEPLDDAAAELLDVQAYLAAFRLLQSDNGAAERAFADLVARVPGDRLAALHLRRVRAGETGEFITLAEK